jgi:hypothetical protein
MSTSPTPYTSRTPANSADFDTALVAEILREIPPAISEALNRFTSDLPELLREHDGKWAAYGRQGRIALGDSKARLYRDCLNDGFKEKEFIVRKIQPVADDIEVLFDL